MAPAALALAAIACLPPTGVRSPESPAAASSMPADEPGRTWTIRNPFPRLSFQNPLFAMMPPGNPRRWFVGEREGRILAIQNDEHAVEKVTVLDLRGQTLGWQDAGLLNMAFHPEFGKAGSPNRGSIYVWYNYTDAPHPGPNHPHQGHPSSNRLSRFTIPDRSDIADPRSELVLIDQHRTNTDHHGGGMFFHPEDGFLYIGVGDGGHPYFESRDDFFTSGTDDPQRIDRDLLSGVLRIDVDCRGGNVSHEIRRQPRNGRTQAYCVPNDNPWLDPAGGVLEEFFAIGLRNPHRMSYDPGTKRIFAGDVGESRIEEVDVVERGANYQWSYLEGDEPYARRPDRVLGAERGPLFAYPHQGFASVTGGFVYRGRTYPELQGRYVFADLGTGQVWTLDAAAAAPAVVSPLLRLPQEMTAYGGVSSFAVDAEGEIYLCILGRNEQGTGSLQKLVRATSSTPPAPATLSGTRLFEDAARLAATKELFPYQINAAFWSDHAVKTRWLFVPRTAKVGFRAEGEWTFPAGTIAVKHFDLQLDEADPAQKRRLETRVIVLDAHGGAYGRTYKWRADQREADLIDGPVTERLTLTSKAPFGPFQSASLGGEGAGSLEDVRGSLSLRSPAGGTLFAYSSAPSDFDVAASWARVGGGSSGLMVREGLAPGAPYLYVAWEGAPGSGRSGRRLRVERLDQTGAPAAVSHHDAVGPWMRLRRNGTALSLFTGEDGHLWKELSGVMGAAGGTHLGIAVAAESGTAEALVSSRVRCEVRDHYYPSNDECMACHAASAGFILGANTRQWNHAVPILGGTINQIVHASRQGLFDAEVRPEQAPGWKKLVSLDDGSATLEDRVRSYLDSNCAQCHRPGSVVQVGIDARYDTPLERQGLIWGNVRSPSVPKADEFIVAPKDVERSRLFTRVAVRRMPPLGSLLLHQQALDLFRDWILSLDGRPALASVTITVTPGAPGAPVRIALSHPDPLARIHFTTDGSAPSLETAAYTGPFQIARPAIIRATAFRDGFVKSRVASREIQATQ